MGAKRRDERQREAGRTLRKDGRDEWRCSKEKVGMAGRKTKAESAMRDPMKDEGSVAKGTEQRGRQDPYRKRGLASGVRSCQGLTPHPRLSQPQPLASGSGS